ncbi:hypothetical protein PSMK_05570 [Phycisphaera mikurensis NBRC 102666]|uniref:Uncharacterized protein n=1 Tax=Phycisphaera mikurensis (strain NBRC 102666 / KCTC 22515 / FYK2301M01) TaxID=1142394 RepID=I0IBS8_PHYMF|nr:hypothetical protein PSMK_05570 [Phycisphaera mikurensis NBRC 102666]
MAALAAWRRHAVRAAIQHLRAQADRAASPLSSRSQPLAALAAWRRHAVRVAMQLLRAQGRQSGVAAQLSQPAWPS